MKKYIITLLLTAFITHFVLSQKTIPAATPESAGFSSERLRRIDTKLSEWTNKGWMNGAAALIIRNGKVVYYKANGYNDLQTKAPLSKEGIFRIASQTKAITSAAVMMLFEEGKFLLDDPISLYIPSFADQQVLDTFNEKDTTYTTVPAKREITVRDLLTHTSGIGYAQIGSKKARAIYAKANITGGLLVENDRLADAMNRLGKLPLMHQPGEKWTYGLNMDVLGYLVEIWSGMTLNDFFNKRIFQPLGMKDTYFNLPQEKANRLVNFFQEDSLGHLRTESKLAGLNDMKMDYPLHPKTYFSGGAGLSSTIYDYGIFLQMLLNEGVYNGQRLLSRASVRMMTVNQIGDLTLDQDKFGFGFSIITPQSNLLLPMQAGTYEWGGAFSTIYWVDPTEKLVVLLYRQMWGSHTKEIENIFRVLVYQAIND